MLKNVYVSEYNWIYMLCRTGQKYGQLLKLFMYLYLRTLPSCKFHFIYEGKWCLFQPHFYLSFLLYQTWKKYRGSGLQVQTLAFFFYGRQIWRQALNPGQCLLSLAEICKEVKVAGFCCSAEMPEREAQVSTARQHTPLEACTIQVICCAKVLLLICLHP